MKTVLRIFLLALLPCISFAQDFKRTYNWYFGDSAGINFSSASPTPIINGQMQATEGCAVISDTNGNLLFYTDGITVWNKNHQVMQNGTGLLSSYSSTQAALIIPQPDNDSLYYLFTTDAGGNTDGLRYHIVNMNANGGLGEVGVKNILLQTPVCEKLAATKHQNGRDYWILAHGFPESDIFFSYLVTERGLIDCPILSQIGSQHGIKDFTGQIHGYDAQGDMKFSSDGEKLAVNVYGLNRIEIFNFDKGRGEVVFSSAIIYNYGLPYSVEFSPNKKFIYGTNRINHVYKYDISLSDSTAINNSKDTLYDPNQPGNSLHTMVQLGSDNKIYISLVDSNYLSIINYPDSPGMSCGFQLYGPSLGSHTGKYGLPNFVSSYFYRPRLDFSYMNNCGSNTYQFFAKDTTAIGTWNWRFRKMANNSTVSYATQNSFHTFSDTGDYEVRLIADADTVIKNIHIYPSIQVNLGKDTTLCDGDSILLNAENGFYCYKWHDSSSLPFFKAKQTGTYYVTVTNEALCSLTDTINILFATLPKPLISRVGDTLFASTGNYAYQWYKDNQPLTGDTLSFTVRSTDGSYKVKVTSASGCSIFSDTYNTTGEHTLKVQPFRVYPNPAWEILSIESNENYYSFSLTDITGKELLQDKGSYKTVIPLQKLTNGIYLLKIHTPISFQIVKFIVQH
ncbi:MAG: T9SS type A sorting domain-containing protein [Bacteroidia bacterium]|nr:T9SS type A sorting domain-containing protein [Bacteroidia bacterium]